ncbi:MAG: hypothetical protein ACYCY0_12540, partial [Acidithiobacillus ferrivorans]
MLLVDFVAFGLVRQGGVSYLHQSAPIHRLYLANSVHARCSLDSTVRDQKLKTIFEKLIAISFIVTACLLFLSAWSLMVWSIW